MEQNPNHVSIRNNYATSFGSVTNFKFYINIPHNKLRDSDVQIRVHIRVNEVWGAERGEVWLNGEYI